MHRPSLTALALAGVLVLAFAATPVQAAAFDLSLTANGGESGRLVVEERPLPPPVRSPYAIPEDPDRRGIRRDTYYFLFGQFAVISVLYAMPESVSGWSEEQKEDYNLSQWWDNVSEPLVWDKDRWYLNYVLHPYWGGAYYVRARERGYGDDEAFWYSVLLSTLFEFGAEALFETPSVQDMIITPGIGYFVGRYFMYLRNNLRADLDAGYELRLRDRLLLAGTDPLGAVSQTFDRLFGIDGEYVLSPFMTSASLHRPLHPHDDDDLPPGHAFDPGSVVPGVHLSMRW